MVNLLYKIGAIAIIVSILFAVFMGIPSLNINPVVEPLSLIDSFFDWIGSPRDEPELSDSSTEPNPTNSTEPNPTNSTEPNPTNSTEPNPTNSTEPNPTNSTEPNPTNSTEPNPTNSTEPNPTNSTEPNPTNSTEPNPTNSTEPNPTNSTEPNPTNSTEPNPTNSTEPNPTNSTEPNPTNSTEPNLNENRVAEIRRIIDEAGYSVPKYDEKDVIVGTETADKGNFRYIYEKHDAVDNIDSIVYLGLNDDVIWPGSLIKGTNAQHFVYIPITVDRAPQTLSISLEGSPATGTSLIKTVENPKLSTVRQGISDMLKTAIISDTRVPARVDFKYQQVNSESQMDTFLGTKISHGLGNLETKFDWTSQSKQNKIMASYKQIYYTIDVDTPVNPAALFNPNVPIKDIEEAIPANSMPLYVSSVSYGIMAVVFIETDDSFDTMKTALDASFKAYVDGSISISNNVKEILGRSNIKTVVYGGSTAGLQELETGFNGFIKVISASKDFNANSPGVLLVYRFRQLSDNTLAQISLTSQYTLTKTLQLRQTIRITADKFVCTMANENFWDQHLEMDRFGVWATAYNGGSSIIVDRQEVFWEQTGGDWGMEAGSVFYCEEYKPNSIDITFDTLNYNFDSAKLKIEAYGREWNGGGSLNPPPDSATAYWEITGDQFLQGGGTHTFRLSDDREKAFTVYFKIELL